MKNFTWPFLVLTALFVAACAAPAPSPSPSPTPPPDIKTLADGTKYIVHPDRIVGGGPPKDGIPSIDDPKFVPLAEADEWIEENELVLGFSYKGEERVYPLQIMVWHEIVNDVVAGDPLLITY